MIKEHIPKNVIDFIRTRRAYRNIWGPKLKCSFNNKNKYMYFQKPASRLLLDDKRKQWCISPEVLYKYDIESFDIDVDDIINSNCEFMQLFNKCKDKITYVVSAKGRIKFWVRTNIRKQFSSRYNYSNGMIEYLSWKQCDYGINTDPDNNWYDAYNLDKLIVYNNSKELEELLEYITNLEVKDNMNKIKDIDKTSNVIKKPNKKLTMMDENNSKYWIEIIRNPDILYNRFKEKRPLGDGYTADNGLYYKWFYKANIYANETDWLNFVEYINKNIYNEFYKKLNDKGLLTW